jgi:hypothetical protein
MGALINEDRFGVIQLSIDVASIANNATAEQTFACPGLRVGDFVEVSKPSHSSGVVIGNARVSAANTIAIQFSNVSGGAVDPAAETYLIFWFRPEKTPTVVNP